MPAIINVEHPEIKFAIQAVQQAAKLAALIQTEMVNASLTKQDRSPVTIADFACQALVAHMLAQVFPNDAFVAEEQAAVLRQADQHEILEIIARFLSRFYVRTTPDEVCRWIDRGTAEPRKRFWTLDPIDGTKGFLRGDQYAVAMALIVDGRVQLGALGCPKLESGYLPNMDGPGSLIVAAKNQGAWFMSLLDQERLQPIHVSNRENVQQARLLRSVEAGHTNVEQIDRLVDSIGLGGEPVRMDSQAKYAVLASGHAELVIRLLSPSQPDYQEKIWDQAAGSIIVEEAGGRITDLQGKTLDFSVGRTLANNRGVVASNGFLHETVMRALDSLRT